MIFTYKLEI